MADDLEALRSKVEGLERGQKFLLRTLGGQLDEFAAGLKRANARLIALAGLLVNQGATITPEEWDAATSEILAAKAVDDALDPRLAVLHQLVERLLSGEDISDEEVNRIYREAEERKEDTDS